MKLVFTALGATSSSCAGAAAPIANPPIGITGASGKFSLFFKTWLSSDTSRRLRVVISATIFSIFGDTGLSTPSGTGIDRGGGACATSWRNITLEKSRIG